MHNGKYIICDNCGRDLTVSTNSEAFRTVLHAEAIPPWDGPLTDMADRPEPSEPLHFCAMIFLAAFIEKHRGLRG